MIFLVLSSSIEEKLKRFIEVFGMVTERHIFRFFRNYSREIIQYHLIRLVQEHKIAVFEKNDKGYSRKTKEFQYWFKNGMENDWLWCDERYFKKIDPAELEQRRDLWKALDAMVIFKENQVTDFVLDSMPHNLVFITSDSVIHVVTVFRECNLDGMIGLVRNYIKNDKFGKDAKGIDSVAVVENEAQAVKIASAIGHFNVFLEIDDLGKLANQWAIG